MQGRIQIQDSSPLAVADPGFPRGLPTPEGGANLFIWHNIIFAENCIWKKLDWEWGGAHVARTFLDPPLPHGMCQPNNFKKFENPNREISRPPQKPLWK